MGMFFSALTRNQIVAAVLAFVGMLAFLFFLFIGEQFGVGLTGPTRSHAPTAPNDRNATAATPIAIR